MSNDIKQLTAVTKLSTLDLYDGRNYAYCLELPRCKTSIKVSV